MGLPPPSFGQNTKEQQFLLVRPSLSVFSNSYLRNRNSGGDHPESRKIWENQLFAMKAGHFHRGHMGLEMKYSAYSAYSA